MIWLWIAAGGAMGAIARHGLGSWIHHRAGFEFPWGTFVVNALGCLLIGFAMRSMEVVRIGPDARAMITIGLLGGFTTFSTFGYETMALLEARAWPRAIAYAGGSLLLGIAAVYAGVTLAAHLLHLRG